MPHINDVKILNAIKKRELQVSSGYSGANYDVEKRKFKITLGKNYFYSDFIIDARGTSKKPEELDSPLLQIFCTRE